MARILLAWELGSGLGHVLPLRRLGERLQAAGHELLAAARDLPKLRSGLAGSAIATLGAPQFPGLVQPLRQLSALSDVLWSESGGHSTATATALFGGWRDLLGALRIDLLVADSAQFALAAAAGQCRTLGLSGAFHASDPAGWGIYRDWERVDAAGVQQRAVQLLAHVDAARAEYGLAPAADLAAAFAAQCQVVRCLPEFDHFGPRPLVRYLGSAAGAGLAPDWPQVADSRARRVFVYLRRDYPHGERLLGALQRLPQASVLVMHDGLPQARLPGAPQLRYSTRIYDLASTLPEADLVVCHGGNMQTHAAMHGKPMLLLPLQTENYLTARCAVRSGAALLVMPPLDKPDFLGPLKRLLDEPAFAASAVALAAAQRARAVEPLAAMAAEVEALLAAPVPEA